MTALEILIQLVREFEGCSLEAYQCAAGRWTIGWGFTHGIKKGDVWTQEKADKHLVDECIANIGTAIKHSPVLEMETIQRQAAIADFIYNLGIGAYKSSTLKKKVDEGRWSEAFTEIQRWNKCGGKVLAGLTIRRNKEATLLLL